MVLKKLAGLLRGVGKTSDANRERVKRASRVQLYPLHDVAFLPSSTPNHRISVANISASGLGLLCDSDKGDAFAVGTTYPGRVDLRGASYPVELQVKRVTSEVVGCVFASPSEALQHAIEEYFEIELAAMKLIGVNSEILKKEEDGNPYLFRGGNKGELFYVEKNDKIVRFELSLLGNYIEGGQGRELRFGVLHGEKDEKIKYKGSALVKFFSSVPTDVATAALKFIDHVPGMNAEHRSTIRKALEGHPI